MRKGFGLGVVLHWKMVLDLERVCIQGCWRQETHIATKEQEGKRERRKDAVLPAFLVVRYIILFFFFPPMPAHRGPADISTQPGNTHTSTITTLQDIHTCVLF